MKYSVYIVIALMALLASCTKAELCEDAEHPHRAGVRFDYDWNANVTSDMKATHQLPDSMLVLVKRIVGTELTGCRVNANDGKGFYLFNGPYAIPTTDDTGDTDETGDDSGTGSGDDTGTGDDSGSGSGGDSGTGDDTGGGNDGDGEGGTDTGGDTDGGTPSGPAAAPVAPATPVPGYNTPTDLFKVRPGMFKCITVNRDTTEFEYKEILDYVESGWPETPLHDLCVEYKRYKYGSPKLRNQVPGWTDYNIYGDADNFLQPDMAPVYYDSISPCTIDRNTEQTFTFRPILLTQNIDIRFHIIKEGHAGQRDVPHFAIEDVFAEISGIPYRLNLSRDVFDIRNTAKMRFTCDLRDANGNAITTDTESNDYVLCHGNIDVLSLVNAPNEETTRGPGIMQLMIKIKGRPKVLRARVNLFYAIERANLYKITDDGEWAVRRKSHGVLEIDTGLAIDDKAVITQDEDGGLDKWVEVGRDEIIVDA